MATPIQPFGKTVSSLAKEPANKQDGPFGQQIAALAKDKKFTASDNQNLLNKTILEGALTNSQNRGDKALALLFKTALTPRTSRCARFPAAAAAASSPCDGRDQHSKHGRCPLRASRQPGPAALHVAQ